VLCSVPTFNFWGIADPVKGMDEPSSTLYEGNSLNLAKLCLQPPHSR
jgi:hypothetical protein